MGKSTGIDTDRDGYISAKEYLSEVESKLNLEEPRGDFKTIYSDNFVITFLLKCIKYFNGPMKKIACVPDIGSCVYIKKNCLDGSELSSECFKFEYTKDKCSKFNNEGDLLLSSFNKSGFVMENVVKNPNPSRSKISCGKNSINNKFLSCLFPFTYRYSKVSTNEDLNQLVIRGPFDNLDFIINKCKKNGLEIVIFTLVLYPSEFAVRGRSGHANCLIINILKKTIERFDPHGANAVAVYNQVLIDDTLKNIFSDELKNFTYINFYDSCPYVGPQALEDQYTKGLCNTWTALYIVLRILNPTKTQDFIVRKMKTGDNREDILRILRRFQKFMINTIKLNVEENSLKEFVDMRLNTSHELKIAMLKVDKANLAKTKAIAKEVADRTAVKEADDALEKVNEKVHMRNLLKTVTGHIPIIMALDNFQKVARVDKKNMNALANMILERVADKMSIPYEEVRLYRDERDVMRSGGIQEWKELIKVVIAWNESLATGEALKQIRETDDRAAAAAKKKIMAAMGRAIASADKLKAAEEAVKLAQDEMDAIRWSITHEAVTLYRNEITEARAKKIKK